MQLMSFIEKGALLAVSMLLLWAAIADLRYRKIPNKLVLSIAILFGLWASVQLSKEGNFYGAILEPLMAAAIVFTVCAGLFALRIMGGGDVKLLTAVALFAGPTLSVPFILYVVIAGGFVALGTLLYGQMKQKSADDTPLKVPYGVAIMAGGFWVCFQRYSLVLV